MSRFHRPMIVMHPMLMRPVIKPVYKLRRMGREDYERAQAALQGSRDMIATAIAGMNAIAASYGPPEDDKPEGPAQGWLQ